jgi:predicted GIY-YIG superfamily endonuclease
MKKWYVYELVNLMGTVEYVGETIEPNKRLYNHKCNSGKFSNRNDIFMNIVKEFDNRKEAWYYQCELQNEYGLISDRDKNIKNNKLGFNKGGDSVKRSILCYSKCKSNFIGKFSSLTDAANKLKISVGNIGNVLSGRYKQTNGYYFEYKNKNSID